MGASDRMAPTPRPPLLLRVTPRRLQAIDVGLAVLLVLTTVHCAFGFGRDNRSAAGVRTRRRRGPVDRDQTSKPDGGARSHDDLRRACHCAERKSGRATRSSPFRSIRWRRRTDAGSRCRRSSSRARHSRSRRPSPPPHSGWAVRISSSSWASQPGSWATAFESGAPTSQGWPSRQPSVSARWSSAPSALWPRSVSRSPVSCMTSWRTV